MYGVSVSAVFGAGAAAAYLLGVCASGGGDPDREPDDVDERIEQLACTLRKRNSDTSTSTLESELHNKSGRRVERLHSSVVFEPSHGDLLELLEECINPSLSPSDNAAALLHLAMSDNSMSRTAKAVHVYAIKALKSDYRSTTLPAALMEVPSHSNSVGIADHSEAKHTRSDKVVSKMKRHALGIMAAQRMAKSSKSIKEGDERDASDARSVVYAWLRNEYSTYGSVDAEQRRRSSGIQEETPPGDLDKQTTLGAVCARSMAFERRPHCPLVMSGITCYDPQMPEQISAINKALEGVDQWEWEIFPLVEASQGHPLQVLGLHILQKWDLPQKLKIDEQKLCMWLAYIESQYVDTPYHNQIHAADVTQTVHAVLASGGFRAFLSDLQVLALLLTAMMHDVGHDGFNNNYHKQAQTERALTFNDQSIQENYHLRVLFESMRAHESIDIFRHFDAATHHQAPKESLKSILYCDFT